MRTLTLTSVMFLAASTVSPVQAQSLAERVAQAPAGRAVVFTYAAKPGVCGDGDNIINIGTEQPRYVDLNGTRSIVTSRGRHSLRSGTCEFGPVRIALEREGTAITAMRTRVGVTEPASNAVDLGTVTPDAAADFLLGYVVRSASRKAAENAVFAATLGDGVEPWPELLRIARDASIERGVRKAAVFWVGQAAGDRATAGLRDVVDDASGDVEVRESAVFALSQRPDDEAVPALIEIARNSPEAKLRRSAIFWLGQSDDPRALAFFEEILLRG